MNRSGLAVDVAAFPKRGGGNVLGDAVPPLSLKDVRVGDMLRPRVQVTTLVQQVQFSGAVQAFSAIHFDVDYAGERGFPTVIVHGFLKAAFLAELELEWAGMGSWFRTFGAKYRGIDVVGAPIVCNGRVERVWPEDERVALELWTTSADGKVTTTADGVIQVGCGEK